MVHYPWTRHRQRYEYVLMRGWVSDKVVVDIGAGTCEGSYSLSHKANVVFAVDTSEFTKQVGRMLVPSFVGARADRLVIVNSDLFDFVGSVDVAVVIEVFEHIPEPQKLIDHLAGICRNMFITTPLALVTGKSRNGAHIKEYSVKDFESVVGTRFNILERNYQTADLRIIDKPEFGGDSFDLGHVVQMLWCEVKK